MISQQVNNNFAVQTNSAQVSFVGNPTPTRELASISSGLTGSSSTSASSSSAQAGVEVAGGLAGALGQPREGVDREAVAQSYKSNLERTEELREAQAEEAFRQQMADPSLAAGYSISNEGRFEDIAAYSQKWTERITNYTLGSTLEGGQGDYYQNFQNISVQDFVMDPQQAQNYYQQLTGYSAAFNPADSVQSCAPSFFTDGSMQSRMTEWNNQVLQNLQNGQLYQMPSFVTEGVEMPNLNTMGTNSAFRNTMPNLGWSEEQPYFKTPDEFSQGYDFDTQAFGEDLAALNERYADNLQNMYPAMGDLYNTSAYDNLTALYQKGSVSADTKVDDQSQVIPEFDMQAYAQSLQGYYSQAYADLAADYASALSTDITENPGLRQIESTQSTAMSTSQLVAKYNMQQTDGLVSLDELKAMYEKAFAVEGASAYMA